MAQLIGIIQEISGVFYVKGTNGEMRVLKAGDQLFAGETIIGDSGNSAQSFITFALNEGGKEYTVSANEQLLLDNTLLPEELASGNVVQPEDLEEALMLDTTYDNVPAGETAAGAGEEIANAEDIENLEETAAAGTTEVDALAGRFEDRTGDEVDITTDLRDATFPAGTETILDEGEDIIEVEENLPPSIVVDAGNPTGADDVVYESGMAAGSDSTADTEFAYGTFTLSDSNGLDTIQSVTINGVVIPIADLGNNNTISTPTGVLTVTGYNPATGVAQYQYELTTATTDIENQDETDMFTLTTTDGELVSDPATINITIVDDVPQVDVGLLYGGDFNLPVLTTQDADTIGTDSDSSGAVPFGSLFTLTQDMGADQGGTPASLNYELSFTNSDTGLQSNGENITLVNNNGVIEGRTSLLEPIFTISVDSSGNVTLIQNAVIDHLGEGDDNDPTNNDVNNLGLVAGNVLLTATASITDADGDTATDSQSIDISSAVSFDDDVPTAVDHTPTVTPAEDTAIDIDVTSDITSGADGVSLSSGVAVTTQPASGTVVYNGDGTFTYTPTAGEEGSDSFVYTVTDADGDTDTATVNITLAADSTPSVTVTDGTVNEAALSDGSSPALTTEVATGTFTIGTGNDTVQTLSVGGVNVTNGGTVNGTYGTLVVANNSGVYSWTYTLNDNTTDHTSQGANIDGVKDEFNVTVTDSDGDTSTADTLTVEIIDDVPTAVDHTPTVTPAEDTAIDIDVTSDITSGADGVSLSSGVAVTTQPASGTVVYNGDGTFTYTPTAGEEGSDSFVYTVTDADGDTDTATVNITLAADSTPSVTVTDGTVNEAALSDGSSPALTTEVATGTFTIGTGNDTVQTLSVGGVNVTNGGTVNGTYGTLVVANNSGVYSWTYTLNDNTTDHTSQGANIDGVKDEFNVTVTDSDGDTSTADTLTVEIIDDVPTAVDHTPTVTPAEDTAIDIDVTSDITSGADGVSLSSGVAVTTQPASGTVVYNGDGTFTYTPTAGEEGSDSFVYTVTDADGDTDTATVNITLAADSTPSVTVTDGTVNEAALSDGSSPALTTEVATGTFTIGTGNDTVQTLSVGGVNVTNGGTVNGTYGTLVVANNSGVYSWTYTLNDNTTDHTSQGANIDGVKDEFNVTVTDSDGDTSTADTLTVEIIDDVPTAVDHTPTVTPAEDTAIDIDVTSDITSGADGVSLSSGVAVTTQPASGTVVYNGDGTFTYTPTAGEEGSDSFVYTVTDADGDTDTATVNITLAADSTPSVTVTDGTVNEAALSDGSSPALTTEVATGTFTIGTGNDTVQTLSVGGVNVTNGGTVNGTYGTLVVANNSGVYSWTYTLNDNTTDHTSQGANIDGVKDEFNVTVTDSDGDTSTADTLTVEIIDDVPTAVDHTPTVTPAEDTAIDIDVTSDITSGADGVSLSSGVAVTTQPASGTVVYNGDGTFTYTPTAGEEGSDSFVYTVTDADGDTDTATVNITLAADSTPSVTVTDGTVNEAALSDGSSPALTTEVATGTFTIGTGNDTVQTLSVGGVNVTNGGTVNGTYGTLVVANNSGVYSWTYTLNDNTTDHTSQGANIDGVKDEFNVTVTDSDGDTSTADTLTVEIIDDVPTAVDHTPTVTPAEDTAIDIDVTSDITSGADGVSLSSGVAVTTQPASGTVVYNGDGTFTYTPTAGEEGSDSFVYTVTDADGDTDTATVNITLAADSTPSVTVTDGTVNEAALSDGSSPALTTEVATGTFTIGTGNDTVQTLSVGGVNVTNGGTVNGTYGTLVVANNSGVYSWTYTLNDNTTDHTSQGANIDGVKDEFNVTVTDSDGDTSTADTLTVEIIDDVPTAVDHTPTVTPAEDTAIDIDVTSDITSGADGVSLSSGVAVTTQPASGTVVYNGDGTFTYTPTAGEEGSDSFVYTVTDADGDTDTATVNITLAADSTPSVTVTDGTVNEAALSDGSSPALTTEVATGTFTIGTGNDTVQTLSVGGVNVTNGGTVNGTYGTLVVANNSGVYSWTYTLNDNTTDHTSQGANIDGVKDEFNVTVTDSDGDTSTADTLTVEIIDDVPTAVDHTPTVTPAEDTAIDIDVTSDITSGADGVSLSSGVAVTTQPASGTVVYNGDGTFTYTPTAGEEGSDSFVYTVTDADGDTDTATVNITLAADSTPSVTVTDGTVNEAALSDGSSPALTTEVATGTFTIGTGNDTVQTLSVGGVNVTNGGTVNGTYGTLVVANNSGVYSWTYTLNDNTTDHTSQGANIDGVKDEFNVTVTDSDGDTSTADTLTVEIIDDVPTAVDHTPTVTPAEDTAIDIDVTSDITSGADGVSLSSGVAVTTQPASGTVVYNGDGTFTYTPTAGEEGSDSFVYTVTDADGDTDTATVNITLAADSTPSVTVTDGTVNEAALSDGSSPALTTEVATGTFTIGTGNDTVQTLSVGGVNVTNGGTVNGTYGTLVVANNSGVYSWTYTLNDNTTDHTSQGANIDGVKDEFNVTVTDSDGDTSTADTLTVEIIDDVPTAVDHTPTVTPAEDTAIDIDVTSDITSGADGVSLSSGVAVTTQPASGTVVYNGDGTFTYTPTAGEEGSDSFVYTVTDADGDTDTATVNITLAADSTPSVTVTDGTVNEAALSDGSSPALTTEVATGTFTIGTGNDTVQTLSVGGVNVTNGGTVNGTYGTLVVANNSGVYSWTYTLNDNTTDHTSQGANIDGVKDEFNVTVTDSDGDTSTADTLTVEIIDDVPTAVDHTPTVTPAEDTAIDIDVTSDITSGADGVSLSSGVAVTTQPASGTVVYNGDGTFTYTPTAGEEGSDSFVYTVTDADGDTDTATVNITLAADSTPSVTVTDGTVNEAALSDGSSPALTTEVATGTFTIGTGNDTVQTLSVGGVNVTNGGTVNGTYGTLVVANNSGVYSWTYTLNDNTTDHTSQGANIDGVKDEFNVTVTDSDGDTSTADTLTVEIIDDVPTAVDHTPTVTPAEDTAIDIDVTSDITSGADGVSLSSGVAVTTQPASGTVVYNGDGTFTYTPTAGEEGSDSFVYTVTDADGDTDTATVNITLAADSTPSVTVTDGTVNEAALSDGSSPALTTEVATGTFTIGTGNDTVQTLSVGGVNVTNGGTVNGTYGTLVVANNSGVYSWTYTLNDNTTDHTSQGANIDGVKDEFNVTVTDSDGDTSTADTLTVEIIDDVPTAVDHTPTVTPAEDTAIDIDVTSDITSGADGVSLSSGVAVTTQPASGTVVYNGDGTFTYTPTAGEEGSDSFVYTVTDADGDTDTATVNITLAADSTPSVTVTDGTVNEAALSDGSSPALTTEVATGTFTIGTGNDTVQTLSVGGVNVTNGGTVNGTYGTLVVANNSGVYSWTYTLNDNTTDHTSQGANIDGVKDEFNVTVTDSDGDTSTADTLTVEIIDDVPTAVDHTPTVTPAEDTAIDIDVTSDITSGADGVSLSSGVAVTTQPASGTVVYNGDGTFTYTPTAGEEGSDSFVYTVTDADGDTDTATVNITLAADSTPSVTVTDGTVNEAALSDGSSPALTTEVATGTFTIGTGNDTVQTLSVGGVNVTNGGTVNGTYGTLVVANNSGVYSWTYTLNDNTTDHTSQGANIDGVKDEFNVTVTDSDGDTSTADTLTVEIIDDVPTITSVESAVLDNEASGYADGASILSMGADQPGSADLTGNISGWDGSTVTYAASTLTSSGDTVYYFVDPTNTGILYGYTDSSTTPGEYDSSSITQSLIFTLSYDASGNYVIDMNGKLDSSVETYGTAFVDNTGGNQDYLLITDAGNMYKPGDTIPSGEEVIMTIDSSGGEVNSSTQGLAAGSQWVTGTEVMYFTYTNPVVSASFTIDVQAVASNEVHWVAYGTDSNGNLVQESGDMTFTEGVSQEIPTTLTSIVSIHLSDNDGGNGFRISGSEIVTSKVEDPVNTSFEVGVVDEDGDTATSTLDVQFNPVIEGRFIVGSPEDDVSGATDLHTLPQASVGALEGGAGDDVISGDPGGTTLVPGSTANIIFVLDISGSMTTNISFGTGTTTRIEALKSSVIDSLGDLAASGAQAIRVHLVSFDESASSLGTFDISTTAGYNAAVAAINGLSTGGGTNYEAGLVEANNWINSTGTDAPLADADVNKLVFVSDGEPNYALNNDGDPVSTSGGWSTDASEVAMAHVLGTYDTNGSANDDNVNDVLNIETIQGSEQAFTIEAIGINVSSDNLALLSLLEGDGGDATNVTSAEELTSVIGELSGASTIQDAVADDYIEAGEGNDLIFGDVFNTDQLAIDEGLSTPEGSGWLVFQQLENGNGTTTDWDRTDTLQYILDNQQTVATESGREGGNDEIYGGAGDDVIFGQEGNDTIDGGEGIDTIYGGSGDDTIVFDPADTIDGGAGSDTLLISGSMNIDFSNVNSIDSSRIDNIETIDLRGGGTNIVTNLTIDDVFDMTTTDSNINTLKIIGDSSSSDRVQVDTGHWTDTGTTENIEGIVYNVYDNSNSAVVGDPTVNLLVQQDIVEEI